MTTRVKYDRVKYVFNRWQDIETSVRTLSNKTDRVLSELQYYGWLMFETWFECCSTLSRVAVSGSDLFKIAHMDGEDNDADDALDDDDGNVLLCDGNDSWCRNADNFFGN